MDEAERCTRRRLHLPCRGCCVLGQPDELKALPDVTPAGTRRFELGAARPGPRACPRCAPSRACATRRCSARRSTCSSTSASTTGARLPRARRRPREARDPRRSRPTLEDVFVTLTRGAAAASGRRRRGAGEPAATTPSRQPPAPGGRPRPRRRAPSTAATGLARDPASRSSSHIRRQPSTLVLHAARPGDADDHLRLRHRHADREHPDGRLRPRRPPARAASWSTRSRTRARSAIVERVHDEESFRRALTSGRAQGRRHDPARLHRPARSAASRSQVQVLIDGSDSQVATTALNAAQPAGHRTCRSDSRPFARRSARVAPARDPSGARRACPSRCGRGCSTTPTWRARTSSCPGWSASSCSSCTLFLTSFAIVRERELGTLEQLFVTPVGRAGLLLGKLVALRDRRLRRDADRAVRDGLRVRRADPRQHLRPAAGAARCCSWSAALGLGLLVSTLAKTQVEAMQFAFMIMLPSVLLSGFMFPRAEMPLPIYLVTFAIPVTYFIEILRGIVLRGAELVDLTRHLVGLGICRRPCSAAASCGSASRSAEVRRAPEEPASQRRCCDAGS